MTAITLVRHISRPPFLTSSIRFNSTLTSTKELIGKSRLAKKSIHPTSPAITRFAPSPTGFLHIGSLRTALYNYLLARNTGGKFILRLEDTDQKRLKPGAEANIYETLEWCGIRYDGEPIKQTARREIYQEYIEKLLASGHAYRCFCSKERLDSMRYDGYDRRCLHLSPEDVQKKIKESDGRYIIRFKSPDHYPSFTDLLHGTVNIQERKEKIGYGDPVLVKSDGLPTYHFANVVDDHLMGITHVIRGEEWMPSTPKHIALYEAFNWEPPKFVHIPLLTNVENDKKLSKRQNDASVIGLREMGVLPEALLNFVALLGWSPPRELGKSQSECYTLGELVKLFNLDHLTRGNVKVDTKKLWYFNRHFLQEKLKDTAEFERIVLEITPQVEKKFGLVNQRAKVGTILKECGGSLNAINGFVESFSYFFEKPVYDVNSLPAEISAKRDDMIHVLTALQRCSESSVTPNAINKTIKDVAMTLGSNKKFVFQTLRLALTGDISGVKLPVIVSILGVEETQHRIQGALKYLTECQDDKQKYTSMLEASRTRN